MKEGWLKRIEPTSEDVEQPPRYVDERYYADGTVFYRYTPPRDAREEGIVEGQVLGVGEGEQLAAYRKADELNRLIDEWRLAKRYGDDAVRIALGSAPEKLESSSIRGLVDTFLEHSFRYKMASATTQGEYEWGLGTLINTEYEGRPIGWYDMTEIGSTDAQAIYNILVEERGIASANSIVSQVRRVYNQMIQWEFTDANPFSGLDTLSVPTREARQWSVEEVAALLDTARDDRWHNAWRYLMLAQHMGLSNREALDLTWEEIDLSRGTMIVNRRGKGVRLKIPEDLLKEMYTWKGQQGPVLHKAEGSPLSPSHLSKTLQRLREAAGLPDDLKVGSAFKRSRGND